MIRKVEIPVEERTKPYGIVLANETRYKEDAEWEWLPSLQMKMPTGETKIDPEHIIADDDRYTVLEKGYCRNCHQKIKPYKSTYYKKHLDYCGPHCFEYGMKNDYCEECAKEKTRYAHVALNTLKIVKTEQREEFGNGEYLERKTYSDGMVVEDMSYEDRMRART